MSQHTRFWFLSHVCIKSLIKHVWTATKWVVQDMNVINFRTFLSFLVDVGFSEHVRHLGFLLRTVLFYDAYAEAPV